MKIRWYQRMLSMLLTLVLLFELFPVQCFALETDVSVDNTSGGAIIEETTTDDPAVSQELEPAQVVGEDISKRGQSYKEFILDNGLRLATVYPAPVHYEAEDGVWEEIDNTLVAAVSDGVSGYQNAAGGWSVHFPGQLSGSNAISITKDGYTVSFGMSGELRSTGDLVVASIGDQASVQSNAQTGTEAVQLTPSVVRTSTAQIQTVDLSAQKAQAQYPETVPDKLHSRLEYPTVYAGTSVRYDLSGQQLKESVILSAYDASLWGYRYTLDTGDLEPTLNEDQSIDLKDPTTGQTVLHMPAPFLLDDDGAYCGDVEVVLSQSGDGYLLSYYLPREWLAETDRAWPVVLDPVVEAESNPDNIRDVSVYQQNIDRLNDEDPIHTIGALDVGYDPIYGKMRSYLKYDELPSLSSADVLVQAVVQLCSYEVCADSRIIEAHAVNGAWESDELDWTAADALGYGPVVDYQTITGLRYYAWDITDIARGWYEGENTGVMFKAQDAVEATTSTTSYRTRFASSDYAENVGQPSLMIVFRNNSGLESYWDYTSVSAGRAGTGYINDYTGNLVWVRDDMGFGGNRMPVSISHIYNANDSAADAPSNGFSVGRGWRTNYNQMAYVWDDDLAVGDYYVWEDSDGTSHYFYRDKDVTDEVVYKDEDGLKLTLKVGTFTAPSGGAATVTIADEDGNTSYFDSRGRLICLANNQETKSYINITYLNDTSLKISTITDGAGRKYTFTYSGGLLSTLRYYGTGDTVLRTICYEYVGTFLTSIRDPDVEYSKFTYTDNGLLSSVTDLDGYRLEFGYNTLATGKPNRIASVTEWDNTVEGSSLTISYGKNSTTFTDQSDNVQIKQFNNWGNTLSVQDDQGRAQYAQYANDDPQKDTTKGNRLMLSSKLQSTVGNLICDPSFETTEGWNKVGSTNVTMSNVEDVAYQGERSMKVTNANVSSGTGVYFLSTVEQGATYTFSAYVKTGTASAYLALSDGSTMVKSQTLAVGSDWVRLQVSITTSSTDLTVMVLSTDVGTFYVDCTQLEKTVTASRYNLVSNGDFNYSLDWAGVQRSSLNSSAAPQLDSYVHSVEGDPTLTKHISQTIQISGSQNDVFVVAGWAKAYSVPLDVILPQKAEGDTTEDPNNVPRAFGIQLDFLNGTTVVSTQKVEFSPCLTDWQYASGVAIAGGDYTAVKLTLQYDYNANTAYFDGIQLYKERFGHTYAYDETDGTIKSVTDLKNAKTKYEFNTENELVSVTLPTGAVMTYEYDEYHNVEKATTDTGIVYEFVYDTWGNNTQVSIDSGGVKMTSVAEYTDDGNCLERTTDAAGNVTEYGYDTQTNVLEWVEAPNDSETTRTEYTYDKMYRMASAAVTTDTGLELSASYTYTDDQLTSIETESTTYGFTYGDFGLRTSVKIGGTAFANYTYTDDTHYLDTLTYSNGDSVSYQYDQQGKTTQQTYEDGAKVNYQYDNDGALAKVIDSESGVTSTYYYDLIDRLCHYTEEADGYSLSMKYSFNKLDAVTFIEEKIDGSRRSTSITYDTDQRVTSIRKGSVTESYTYDGYSRVTEKVTTLSGETRLTERYTYRTVDGAPTTQVASHQIITDVRDITYSYTYDSNGNILTVTETFTAPGALQATSTTTSYVYDSQNQLLRENNEAAGKTWTWTYDNAGNILSHGEYAYTTGELGAALDTVEYGYTAAVWGDLLCSYDGAGLGCDDLGNLTVIGDRRYVWKHGRELSQLIESGTTWTYTYNADGLRTKRTDGTTTYQYIYADGQLVKQKIGNSALNFSYDASGTPMSVTYNSANYYYVTNLQGDVIAITNDAGAAVVSYTYDAWGKILSTTGSMADTLGAYNPLRYRGYVYDAETELYYLQSRYYDPEMGRFISPDAFVATGQGFSGNNMFAYCGNAPVMNTDEAGYMHAMHAGAVGAFTGVASTNTVTKEEIQEAIELSCGDWAFTRGIYGSLTVGMFNFTGTLEVALDTEGNVQLQSSFGFDVTSSGDLSASGGQCGSIFHVPDVTSLAGDTTYSGGSVTAPVPDLPMSMTGSVNIGQTSDGYWGMLYALGIAPSQEIPLTKEFHSGYSYTHVWIPAFNVIEWLHSLFT